MGPYNYPLNETFATLIPALLMGNTVVFKPPQYGTLLFYPLLDAFRSAFPPGVINTDLRTRGGGRAAHAGIGQGQRAGADRLEQGGRPPEEAAPEIAPPARDPRTRRARTRRSSCPMPTSSLTVKECLLGALSFNGQRCTALKMLIVHRSIADVFLRRFTEELGKLKVGMPWEAGVNITPLPGTAPHRVHDRGASRTPKPRAHASSTRAAERSARRLFYPAVVYPVREGMKLYREEQFGPIIPVMPFDDLETALRLRHHLRPRPAGQHLRLEPGPDRRAASIPLVNQVCRVNINCQCQRGPDVFPFAGRKDSAEGTLSVTDALRAFSIRSMVAAKQTGAEQAAAQQPSCRTTSPGSSTPASFSEEISMSLHPVLAGGHRPHPRSQRDDAGSLPIQARTGSRQGPDPPGPRLHEPGPRFRRGAGRRQDHAAREPAAEHRDRLVVQRHAVGAPAASSASPRSSSALRARPVRPRSSPAACRRCATA